VLVAILGVGILLMLNSIRPGTVELMTRSLVGQIALVLGFGLFAAGFVVIRRMTRVER
jgi:tight adherence protein B